MKESDAVFHSPFVATYTKRVSHINSFLPPTKKHRFQFKWCAILQETFKLFVIMVTVFITVFVSSDVTLRILFHKYVVREVNTITTNTTYFSDTITIAYEGVWYT